MCQTSFFFAVPTLLYSFLQSTFTQPSVVDMSAHLLPGRRPLNNLQLLPTFSFNKAARRCAWICAKPVISCISNPQRGNGALTYLIAASFTFKYRPGTCILSLLAAATYLIVVCTTPLPTTRPILPATVVRQELVSVPSLIWSFWAIQPVTYTKMGTLDRFLTVLPYTRKAVLRRLVAASELAERSPLVSSLFFSNTTGFTCAADCVLMYLY